MDTGHRHDVWEVPADAEASRSPDMRVAAQAYLDAGYQIVPLLPGTKRITDTGWPDIVYGLDSVRSTSNLGTKCLDPVVDIDALPLLALHEGRTCADAFLPHTPRIDGRPGKPRSHRTYLADVQAEDFKDIDDTMIVQILAGHGKQTVVPPSIWIDDHHPQHQERRAWADGSLIGPPAATVEGKRLRHRVVTMATAAIIARYWPSHGRRKLRLAYARVLLETLGLDRDTTIQILEWACTLGGSDAQGVRHATRAVDDTQKALDHHEQAIGATYIRTALATGTVGAALLRRLREWYDKSSAVDEAVEALNERFFLIDVGTDTVVGEEVVHRDRTRQWSTFRFRPFDHFKKKLVKATIRTGTKKTRDGDIPIVQPLANVWLKHPHGFQYDQLVYAPEGSRVPVGPRDLNGWRGFTVTPAPGTWTLTRDVLIK